MSTANFQNFPPPSKPLAVQSNRLAVATLVRDPSAFAFGLVDTVYPQGYAVKWSTGLTTLEDADQVVPTTCQEYLSAIQHFASENTRLTAEQFDQLYREHVPVFAFSQLASLETALLAHATGETNEAAAEADYEGTWATIEQTAAQEPEQEPEQDIFAAFGVEDEPAASRVTVVPSEHHEGTFEVAVDGNVVEQFFETEAEAQAAVPDWEEVAKEREPEPVASVAPAKASIMCALCNRVKTNKNSPILDDGRRICKKCETTGIIASEKVAGEVVDYFPGAEPEKVAQELGENLFSLPLAEIFKTNRYKDLIEKDDLQLGSIKEECLSLLQKDNQYFFDLYDAAITALESGANTFSFGDTVFMARRLAIWQIATEAENKLQDTIEGVSQPPAAKHYICYQHDKAILAIGSTPEEATDKGAQVFEMQQGRRANPGELIVCAASRALATVAQRVGADVEWEHDRTGLAVIAVPKLAVEDLGAQAASQSSESSTATEQPTQHVPVRLESGLIDPTTGEMLEQSFILRKFGWTELPVLTANSTREKVADFEEKLDQVVDRMSGHLEKAARYRAACEKRCAPYDGAAKFYDEQFVQPMSRMLAVHKLKRDKKGNFSEKTLVLASGFVKFTQTGGATIVDKNAIVEHIKEKGVEQFKAINARPAIDFDSRKLLSLVNKGELKDVPGTQIVPKDPLGKAKVVLPGVAQTQEEGEGDE